jgi:hypothetical protein
MSEQYSEPHVKKDLLVRASWAYKSAETDYFIHHGGSIDELNAELDALKKRIEAPFDPETDTKYVVAELPDLDPNRPSSFLASFVFQQLKAEEFGLIHGYSFGGIADKSMTLLKAYNKPDTEVSDDTVELLAYLGNPRHNGEAVGTRKHLKLAGTALKLTFRDVKAVNHFADEIIKHPGI